jgi:hypothetical protein
MRYVWWFFLEKQGKSRKKNKRKGRIPKNPVLVF